MLSVSGTSGSPLGYEGQGCLVTILYAASTDTVGVGVGLITLDGSESPDPLLGLL